MDEIEFDVVIVGAGPAGLSAAIKLAQLAGESNQQISICVLEKSAEVGGHIVSGAVLEPRALDELLPDWRSLPNPVTKTPVSSDAFYLMTENARLKLPVPPQMKNHGNFVISLSAVCRWLAVHAESLGVQIFPGFSANRFLRDDAGKVIGVETKEMGVAKSGAHKSNYQPAMMIKSKYLLVAEGCRGSLAEDIISTFKLRQNKQPQTYALGIKEVWEINPAKFINGHTEHSIGWPLDSGTYGGSFIYHFDENKVSIGLVTGLDYRNPYLDPFQEFQRFKHHPFVKPLLEGGRRIAYGARALNEGGLQSIPKLTFPGGAIIGCSAGFLNVPKIKGTHTAMKSGMLAAEAVFESMANNIAEPSVYEDKFRNSWIYDELYKERNIRPAFAKFGLLGGLAYAAAETYIFAEKSPWTFNHKPDHTSLMESRQCQPINYPKPDGVISFDRNSSVYLTGTNHEEDQPCHLKLGNAEIPINHNLKLYNAPEQRYCPAGVYEIVSEADGTNRLHINAQNCIHCKTCDIKDPTQNIKWQVPESGGGPNYPDGM